MSEHEQIQAGTAAVGKDAPAKWRSGRGHPQRADEFAAWIDLIREERVGSYLEVGVRHGDTFAAVAEVLPADSVMVAVDLPGGKWGNSSSQPLLEQACGYARDLGHRVTMILGDSAEPAIVERVRAMLPNDDARFGMALIDGDHRARGVLADIGNYAPMCRIVTLHDTDARAKRDGGGLIDVPWAFDAIKGTGVRTVEFVGKQRGMGLGVFWPQQRSDG